MEGIKGACLIRMEDGRNVYQTKNAYLKMKKAGRNVKLIAEACTIEELNKLRGF